MAEIFAKSVIPAAQQVSALLNDKRPRVMLPADNRLLADFAAELATHMNGLLYIHNREVVVVEGSAMRAIGAQELRTMVERRVICCKVRSRALTSIIVGVTMGAEDARGVLASPQFLSALPPLKTVASCRLPVMRADSRIELLPPGYDEASQTITLPTAEYPDDMPFKDALALLRDLFSEFKFADNGRSLAVAVAALIGLYAQQLLPIGTLRPAFVYTKNGEGAGASTAVACAVVPVLGQLPTGAMPDDDNEMRKLLTASLREGLRVVLLDNVKTTIGDASLEAFTSAATWSARLLGTNDTVTVENNATVFATGNGATVTPDMRRRSLVCELHLSEERAEDRIYRRPLNVNKLRAMRSEILAACWALVKHWNDADRPGPSRSHSAFPEWAATIGGIVQHAGFMCPLDTPAMSIVADEIGEAMRRMVAAMAPGRRYVASELYALCRREEVFTHLVGTHEGGMDKSQLSMIGRLLARYHNRLVGGLRFVIEGAGHAKRFSVEGADPHGDMIKHAVSFRAVK